MARVSVIIPTYNSAPFLATAIDSVLAQTYPDVEVIVVDDGSTDDTQAIIAHYDQQIRYIHQENRGPAAARNTGFHASQGDYLLFLDSDDLIPPDKLELQVAFLAQQPDVGLVYSAWQEIDEDNTRLLGEVRPGIQGFILKALLRRKFFFFPSAAIIRRKCLERVGLFNESMRWSEDADLWMRLARAGYAFGYMDAILLQRRIHKSSLSSRVSTNQVQTWLGSLDRFFADPDLPDDIRALEGEAYSILHYETAARYYRAGQIDLAKEQVRLAMLRCPTMDKEWLLEWIAGSVLNARTDEALQLLDVIFDNLPTEATTLRSLRRRAYGRYHTTAAFLNYQNRRVSDVRPHILPALRGDPAIIWNRGFVRIVLQSLLR